MKSTYAQLIELADRLKKENRHNDAELVYSAAFQLIPVRKPDYEAHETTGQFATSTRVWL
jgi:hypothetical protein